MNIYSGLLFQHGYIGNAELARSLAGVAAPPAPGDAPPSSTTKRASPVTANTYAAQNAASVGRLVRCRKLLAGQRLAKAARQTTALSLFR